MEWKHNFMRLLQRLVDNEFSEGKTELEIVRSVRDKLNHYIDRMEGR